MSVIGDSSFKGFEGAVPVEIRKGVFGASFKDKNGEPLFLRMELITEENEEGWNRFKEITTWLTNQNTGVFSFLVSRAGKDSCPKYEDVKKVTGFTDEEYRTFIEEAIKQKEKTTGKIVELLRATSTGSNHMNVFFNPEKLKYIVYVSKNPDFSILEADKKCEEKNLKKYIDSYSDILMAVGSDFSEKDHFYSRGIFRNPYWVFKEKYAGLSMLLHGFTGAVAEKFFPEKKIMQVQPVGSMQVLIKDKLLPEEGYVKRKDEKFDITKLDISKEDPEGELNYIKSSALNRIYKEAMSRSFIRS